MQIVHTSVLGQRQRSLARMSRSRQGQGVAEYGFILVLVSLIAVGTLSTTGGSVSNLMNSVASSISAPFSSAPSGDTPSTGPGSGFTSFLNSFMVQNGNEGFNYEGRQGAQTPSFLNPDGSVTVGQNNYAMMAVPSPPANMPASVTLQLAPGSAPPTSVSIRNADTNSLVYGSLVPGSDGNTATYLMQASPSFNPDMSIGPNASVGLTIANAEVPTQDYGYEVHPSTVIGYQFHGELQTPQFTWE
jgi:Flp pilus assembly pilin Flp